VSGGTPPLSYSWSNNAANNTPNNNNLSAGIYNLIIIDDNGCSNGGQVYTIDQPSQLQPNGSVSQYIVGAGSSNGEITAQVSGGTPAYEYSINGGLYTNDSVFTSLNAGTYTISYKDSSNCVASENIILSDPLPLGGYLSIVSPVSCNGACDATIEFINNNTGTGPFTYSLNGVIQIDNPVFSNLCGDILYTISVTDTFNASLTTSIYLNQPDSLMFNSAVQDINGYGVTCSWGCNGGVSINNVTGGSGSPTTYSFNGGITFGQVWTTSGLCPADYYLAVKDASGCITHDTVSIIAPDSLVLSLASKQDVSCNNGSDGFINISVTGGAGPYTFLWNNGSTNEDISNLPVGSYTVFVTDANGCVASLSDSLIEPTALIIDSFFVQDNFMPYDSNAVINTTVSGGVLPYTYIWTGPNGFSSNQEDNSNLKSGMYYLSVLDDNGCLLLDTFSIVEPGVILGCNDSTALNYNPVANVNNGTCYYCPLDSSFNIYTSLPNNPSSQTSCDGWISTYIDSIYFNSMSYFWSNGDSNYYSLNLCNDVYSLIIVDSAGCGFDTTILLSNFIGCMDSTAFNYDPLALYDDGNCIAVVLGCTDSTFANYNPLANTDDGSCLPYILGCMDILAFNYDALAQVDDGSCYYNPGCTDSLYLEYWTQGYVADFDDGSCTTIAVFGCTSQGTTNYNAFANIDDGSCDFCVTGCMDSTFYNYDSLATCPSVCVPFIYGCTDITAFNYNSTANTDNGTCVAVVLGCTDSIQFNYNANANTDDGSCYQCGFSAPIWTIDTNDLSTCGAYAGLLISSINSSTLNYSWNTLWGSYCCPQNLPNSQYLCLGIYEITVTDIYGCTFVDTIELGNVVLGCTDSTAQNYDPLATLDDGSCCAAPAVDLTIGTWNFDFGYNCPGYDTMYYIIYDTSGVWSNSYSGNWELCGNQYTHTYFNNSTVYTGTYNNGVIEGTMNDGVSPNIGCFKIYLDSNSIISGCMDSLADNYNPFAQVDDGNCIYFGCTDPLACNYDSSANTDNGSCLTIYGCMDSTACNYDPLANCSTSCSGLLGCIDPLALNFNSLATCDDGSCIAVVLGCMDSTAFNYNPLANTDNGSCIAVVLGCMDSTAFNYNTLANTDDGSCIAVVLGCTDSTAFNYNTLANTDDGSCIAVVLGCTDSTALNYNALANTDDGSCIAVVLGCMDSTAFNYNTLANVDDGSCVAVVLGCTDSTALNYNILANTDDGSCIAVVLGCMDSTAFNYNVLANVDDGSCVAVVLGCTDSTALNYNILANTDDGSCIPGVLGCLDNIACNYDSLANIDDGSCVFVSNPSVDMTAGSGIWDHYYDSQCNGNYNIPSIGIRLFNSDGTVTNANNGSSIATWSMCGDNLNFRFSNGVIRYYTYQANGLLFRDAGSGPDSLCGYFIQSTSVYGCTDTLACNYDSIAIIDDGSCLYASDSTTTVTACDSYFWTVDSMSYDSTGIYVVTDGCHTDTLNLTIVYTTSTYDTVSVCFGDSYMMNGVSYSSSGDYIDSIQNNGCWDKMYLNLTVGSQLNSSISQNASTLTSTVSGGFMPYSYLWSTGDISEDIIVSANGLYWLLVDDRFSCAVDTAFYEVTSFPTSVKDLNINSIKVYPNPSTGVFNITFTSESTQDLKVRVTSLLGENIVLEDLKQFVGEYIKKINLKDNSKGTYFLEIETDDGVINKKLILQ
jgi:hypothetical protein